jgi:hypothetical protein
MQTHAALRWSSALTLKPVAINLRPIKKMVVPVTMGGKMRPSTFAGRRLKSIGHTAQIAAGRGKLRSTGAGQRSIHLHSTVDGKYTHPCSLVAFIDAVLIGMIIQP